MHCDTPHHTTPRLNRAKRTLFSLHCTGTTQYAYQSESIPNTICKHCTIQIALNCQYIVLHYYTCVIARTQTRTHEKYIFDTFQLKNNFNFSIQNFFLSKRAQGLSALHFIVLNVMKNKNVR